MANHTTISIHKKLYSEFKQYCDQNGYTVSKLVAKLITEKMSNGNLQNNKLGKR